MGNFRLAVLLRMWANERDECRSHLAEAQREDEAMAERQARLEQEHGSVVAECREASTPGELDVERLIAYRRYDRQLAAQQQDAAARRGEVLQEVELRREALLAADRQVRVLQRLEEKQDQRQAEQEQRCAVRVLDEIAARCSEAAD